MYAVEWGSATYRLVHDVMWYLYDQLAEFCLAIFYFGVPIEIHTSNVCVYSGGDDVYLPLLTLNLG